MSRPVRSAGRLKGFASLESVRAARPARSAQPADASAKATRSTREEQRGTSEFLEAMHGVTPLAQQRRVVPKRSVLPQPLQRALDDRSVLDQSLNDEIGIDSLLDTDDSLSFRRSGISIDTVRKLRKGFWVVQAELDLHGHRVDEAREALAEFLRQALFRGQRCVRIVHGKGLRSPDRTPILKGKVRAWLARRDDVIAFCQARPAEGGAGALVVLLKPSLA
jgi:DNA-nicking Smr family endonuclease